MTLVERLTYADRYHIDGRTFVLKTGGGIYNPVPFDGGSRAPFSMLWDSGVQQGNWKWFGRGAVGYLVKLNTGTVRIYPVRGDVTKYIQVSGLADQVCAIAQTDDNNIEVYREGTYTRWSLKMGMDAFKPEILVRPGYSGDGAFRFRFEMYGGLSLQGAWVMDGFTPLLKLHNPFVMGADGNPYPASESIVNGIATISVDLTGIPLPAIVDPTLGPINPSKDAYIYKNAATTGYGQLNVMALWNATNPMRNVIQMDASAIPAGSTIDSATYEEKVKAFAIGNPLGLTVVLDRLTDYDWEDDGSSTLNAECNWNFKKDPDVAWTGGAGAGVDTTYQATTTIPAVGSWITYNVKDLMQDALDNYSGLFNVREKFATETEATAATWDQLTIYSLEEATAADRPKLTVVYTQAGTVFNRSRIVNMGITGPQNRSTIANA